jgi:hypothetical protein
MIYKSRTTHDFYYFLPRHITVIILQNWEAFVAESPSLFNEIFKKCAEQIHKKLKDHYGITEIADDESLTESLKNDFQTSRETTFVSESDLSQNLGSVFSNMPFTDVELEVEGKVLKAHKIILWGNIILNSISRFF